MTSLEKQLPWPDNFSERFHIFALGEAFDVDAFLATSTLKPDFVWRRKGNGPTNGIEFLLGDGRTTPLLKQQEIAATFLETHRDTLRRLAEYPGVEALNLGMVVYLPSTATGCAVGPPAKLMLHSLDAGVMPLYYVTIAS